MPLYFSEDEYTAVRAACARLIPSDDDPGATEAGVVDYIDGLLGAFHTDPPPGREFCAVGFSGPYRPGEVDRAPAGAAGHYAVITVTMRGTTVLRSFVVDRLPLRLGHR